jgi:DNA polymerase elongation subunit (family B)
MITKRKRLFFDLETSFNIGFFWRSGWGITIPPENIIHERKVICASYKWEYEDEVHTLVWDENQDDKKLLKAFIKILNKADEIVAHNGDNFDIKWLRTRCLYYNLPMFPKYQSIDTLKQSRSLFNFNSNKLDYIAKFLGVGSKTEHEGIDLWKKIIFDKDPDALKRMIAYCENDVVILQKVFNKLNRYTKPTVHYGVLKDYDKYVCPECGSMHLHLSKTYATAMGTVRRNMRCADKSCQKKFTISNKTYQDYRKRLRSIKTK